MKKIISVFLTVLIMCLMFENIAFAGPAPGGPAPGGPAPGGASGSVAAIEEKVGTIVNAVAYFGYAVAVAMFLFVGIKYAMAPANEKADVKQASVNYMIGAFLIVCASGIATVFAQIAIGEDSTTTGNLASEIIYTISGQL